MPQIVILKTTEAYQSEHAVPVEPGKPHRLSDLIADVVITPGDLAAPKYAVCAMQREPNGAYLPVPIAWEDWLPLEPKFLRQLGVNLSRQTLIRLWRNNYIEMRKPSPHSLEIKVESLVKHLRKVTEDPNFWQRTANDGTCRTRAQAYDSKMTHV